MPADGGTSKGCASVWRSGSACTSAATVSAGATACTRPAPAANAARAAIRMAPVIPASPPMTTTLPRCPCDCRRRSRRSHSAATSSVTEPGQSGSAGGWPMSATSTSPTSSRASRWPRRNTTESHREIGSRGAVDGAAQQVHAGWPVHRDEWNLEVEQPFEQRRHGGARRPAGAGAEQRIHRERRQWATGRRARPRARLRPGRAAPCARAARRRRRPGGAVTQTGTSRRWSARASTQPSPPLCPGPAATSTPVAQPGGESRAITAARPRGRRTP